MKIFYIAIVTALILSNPLKAVCELDGASCAIAPGNDAKHSCFFTKTLKLMDKLLAKNGVKYVVFGSYSAYLTGVPLKGTNFPSDVDIAVNNVSQAKSALSNSECFDIKRSALGVTKFISKLGTNIDIVEGEDFGLRNLLKNDKLVEKRDGITVPMPAEILKIALVRPELREKEGIIVAYLLATQSFTENDKKEILPLLVKRRMAAPGATWAEIVTKAKEIARR